MRTLAFERFWVDFEAGRTPQTLLSLFVPEVRLRTSHTASVGCGEVLLRRTDARLRSLRPDGIVLALKTVKKLFVEADLAGNAGVVDVEVGLTLWTDTLQSFRVHFEPSRAPDAL